MIEVKNDDKVRPGKIKFEDEFYKLFKRVDDAIR